MRAEFLMGIEPDDLQYLVQRFQELCALYVSTFSRSTEAKTFDEKSCLLQELRAITDEAKSVTHEYREAFKNKQRSE